jgi:hypothetical protein
VGTTRREELQGLVSLVPWNVSFVETSTSTPTKIGNLLVDVRVAKFDDIIKGHQDGTGDISGLYVESFNRGFCNALKYPSDIRWGLFGFQQDRACRTLSTQ